MQCSAPSAFIRFATELHQNKHGSLPGHIYVKRSARFATDDERPQFEGFDCLDLPTPKQIDDAPGAEAAHPEESRRGKIRRRGTNRLPDDFGASTKTSSRTTSRRSAPAAAPSARSAATKNPTSSKAACQLDPVCYPPTQARLPAAGRGRRRVRRPPGAGVRQQSRGRVDARSGDR